MGQEVLTDDPAALYRRMTLWGIPERDVQILLGYSPHPITHQIPPLTDTSSLAFAKEWLPTSSERPIMVIAGPKGVGKTIAAAYAMWMCDPPPPAGCSRWPDAKAPRFRHVSEIADIGGHSDEDKKARAEIKGTKCLVVDDLGVEYCTDHFKSTWDAIVNARYGCAGVTILTTNLTYDTFAARYGDRVYDRIRGRGEWFDVDGESMRGRSL